MIVRILHHDTIGLVNDAKILRDALEKLNIKTDCHSYPEGVVIGNKTNHVSRWSRVRVQIHLEHILQCALSLSDINVYIPNIECMTSRDVTTMKQNTNIIVFAKTKYTRDIMKSNFPTSVIEYTSWDSVDMYNEKTRRELECLHVKGISKYKQSQLVLDTWLKNPQWPHLHFVCHGHENFNGFVRVDRPTKIANNVTLYQWKISEEQLKYLMNRCVYHICPSLVEGFGHYINEGLSCNAMTIVPDVAPMNELIPIGIPMFDKTEMMEKFGLATGHRLDEQTFTKLLDALFGIMWIQPPGYSRKAYLKNKNEFELNMKRVEMYLR